MSKLLWASRYVKVGPNQVLIVSGRQRQLHFPARSVRGERKPAIRGRLERRI